jgi:hypothetical protein
MYHLFFLGYMGDLPVDSKISSDLKLLERQIESRKGCFGQFIGSPNWRINQVIRRIAKDSSHLEQKEWSELSRVFYRAHKVLKEDKRSCNIWMAVSNVFRSKDKKVLLTPKEHLASRLIKEFPKQAIFSADDFENIKILSQECFLQTNKDGESELLSQILKSDRPWFLYQDIQGKIPVKLLEKSLENAIKNGDCSKVNILIGLLPKGENFSDECFWKLMSSDNSKEVIVMAGWLSNQLGPKGNPYEFIKGVLDELDKSDIHKSFTRDETEFLEEVKTLFPGLQGEDLKKALRLPCMICQLSKRTSNLEGVLREHFGAPKLDWPTFEALMRLHIR